MARGALTAVVGQVQRLFGGGTVAGLDERQCLDRFVARRDPAAFEAIVARHGPMVLGVCRRWLSDPHDADDAFQATFLVLVRRAGDLRDRDLLANWLYGVATRVARRARQQARRRQEQEARAGVEAGRGRDRTEAVAMRPDELGPELHEELRRLPGVYRSALVLCYLEGRTHEEAARELGWPIGTVKGRLARARDLLRDRLARRGVGVTAGAVVAALEGEAAAVPPALLNATLKAVAASAPGRAAVATVVSASVARLTEEALTTMFLNKLATIGAAGLLLAGTVLGGAAAFGRFGGSAAGGQGSGFSLIATDPTHVVGVSVQDEGRAAAPAKAEPTLESAEGLERARLVAAQKAFEALRNFYLHGQVTIDRLIHASEEFRDAQLPADGDPGRTREALQAHLARLEALKMIKEAQFGDGRGSVPDMADINVAVAETKFRLARPLPTTAAPMNSSPQPTGGGGSSQDGGGGGFGGEGLVEDPRVTAARPKFFRGIDDDPLTKEILAKLNLVYSFPFTADTPLEDVIRYIQTVTADNMHFPKGIPVYLDEKGMREGPSGATPQTGVKIALEGIPMRTVLRLMLKQLGLVYIVKDGLLIISSPEADNLLDEIERVPDLAAGRGGKEPPRGAAAPADRPDGRVRDDQSKAMGGGSGGIIPNDPDDPRRLAAEAKLYSALDDEPETAAVVAKLNEFYPFPFGSDTPLEEVMQHISKITECEELPHGIPVYLDEVGMNEANSATPASSVKLGFKRVRLRTALRLALKQLGLVFTVKDGILIVTSAEEAIDEILFGPDRRLREIPQPQGGGFR